MTWKYIMHQSNLPSIAEQTKELYYIVLPIRLILDLLRQCLQITNLHCNKIH